MRSSASNAAAPFSVSYQARKRERRVAELRARHRLRRAQLMHARDRAPDAGLPRCGAVDDLDAAHAFAAELIRDRQAALAAADDDDVVVDAGARAHPVGRIAPDPALRVARLLLRVCCGRVGAGRSGGRWLRRGLCQARRERRGRRRSARPRRGRIRAGRSGSALRLRTVLSGSSFSWMRFVMCFLGS